MDETDDKEPGAIIKQSLKKVNFYLIQFLSSHGYFKGYLDKSRQSRDLACRYCGYKLDDAEHTFLISRNGRANEKR